MRRWLSVALLAIVFAFTSAVPSDAAAICRRATWDLAKDFRTPPSQANPSTDRFGNKAVWSYRAGPENAPADYRLLGDFSSAKFHVNGLQTWWGEYESTDEADRLPSVGLNTTARAVDVFDIHWPAGHILVHPLTDEAVVVAWRSPITGNITVRGKAWLAQHPNCGDGVRWSVRDGAAVLRTGLDNRNRASTLEGSEAARQKGGQRLRRC